MNIRDIAKLCGVGVSTVSRVLNNHPDVKKETRDKVLQVIQEQNYIPNNSARILKSNRTNQIGVLVKGVFNPFFAVMVRTIEETLQKGGYAMTLHHYDGQDNNDIAELIAFIKEKRLSGIICLGGNFAGLRKRHLEGLDVSIVITSVDKSVADISKHISTVTIDNEQAAYDATEYLINQGHTAIALMLGDEYDASVGSKRALGYIRALEDRGITVNRDHIVVGGYSFEAAYETIQTLLQAQPEITALFAISDIMAVGACKGAIEAGYKVPEQLSIIGFDGMDVATYYNPAITTIQQPLVEMAKESVALMQGLMTKKVTNQDIILPTQLIERASCSNKN